jgi:hypothetical protein
LIQIILHVLIQGDFFFRPDRLFVVALLSTESEESVLENDECRFHFLDMNASERDVRFDVNLI